MDRKKLNKRTKFMLSGTKVVQRWYEGSQVKDGHGNDIRLISYRVKLSIPNGQITLFIFVLYGYII